MNYSELFEFEKRSGGLSIKKFLAANDSGVENVSIPTAHDGSAIVGVGFEAFAGAGFLRSVTIPESVGILGGGAFRECTSLENVRIPESICQIPAAAFLGCTKLKRAILCEGIRVIGSNAFRRCTALEDIALPNSIQSIESCAFLECPKLPVETVMMGFAGSADHTKPFRHFIKLDWETALREDVFALALKHNSFRNIEDEELLETVFSRGTGRHLKIMEEAGYFSAERLNALAESFAQKKKTEIAAWLLDCKKRTFGFNGGNNFEL